ncbi:MEDS domain-containing protein [Halegenticoccus tardaugens]|uniref:MEDS domain-containing protein n=1 Tax=Halegenticoccus tardaugens TaxID=2071624 RepID=UPI00100B2CDE|nr:MEDS domain-containing protein [Halegenticoccus tardaugens]
MSRDERRSGLDSAPHSHAPGVSDSDARASEHDLDGSLHDHIALLYANRAEQFAAVVPLIRDGLDRGEHCYYLYDDNTRAEVAAAMREGGIDVDAAVDAGDLSFHAEDELFLRGGAFDPADTVAATEETIRELTGDGHDAVRMVGEMTWVLDGDHSLDRMVEYERILNSVYRNRPVVGICQYNVARFEPEIVNQIVRAHPSLVYGGTAARHFYYLPYDDAETEADSVADTDADHSGQSLFERVRAYETLERRERGLRALNRATQELMYLDGDVIADRAAGIVRNVLDVTFASVWSYDEDTGELMCRSSSAADSDLPVTGFTERYTDLAWNTFVTEETEVLNDRPTSTDLDGTETTLRSGVIVPLGRHGVFCAGSTRPRAFDDPTVDVATAVGANIEAALDRADRERTLRKQNDRLERLNRINRVIRGIDEALVDADTRAEIERIVCERLAAFDPYEFVWVGDRDSTTDAIVPRARAGNGSGYVDAAAIDTDDASTGRGPVASALQTREIQVIQDVLTDPRCKPSREAMLSHGFRATISIPLVYEESIYGVLTLYASSPNAFSELERTVLGELGETIAHAIGAAETRRTLRTNGVTEVTLKISEVNDVLARLAREAECEIGFDGLVPQSGGPDRLFFTAPNESREDVLAGAGRMAGIEDVRVIEDEQEECLFEGVVTESTLASRILDSNAVIRSLTVADHVARIVVDLPSAADVRELIETVRVHYPKAELVARRTRDRTVKTRRDLRNVLAERLTDRQREVLETAYRSGFFESPRVRTGKDVSEALGVTQSTFSYHLREAERGLCELVFENT